MDDVPVRGISRAGAGADPSAGDGVVTGFPGAQPSTPPPSTPAGENPKPSQHTSEARRFLYQVHAWVTHLHAITPSESSAGCGRVPTRLRGDTPATPTPGLARPFCPDTESLALPSWSCRGTLWGSTWPQLLPVAVLAESKRLWGHIISVGSPGCPRGPLAGRAPQVPPQRQNWGPSQAHTSYPPGTMDRSPTQLRPQLMRVRDHSMCLIAGGRGALPGSDFSWMGPIWTCGPALPTWGASNDSTAASASRGLKGSARGVQPPGAPRDAHAPENPSRSLEMKPHGECPSPPRLQLAVSRFHADLRVVRVSVGSTSVWVQDVGLLRMESCGLVTAWPQAGVSFSFTRYIKEQ